MRAFSVGVGLCFEGLCGASAVSMELDAPRGAEPEAPVQGGGVRGPRPGGRSPRPPSRGGGVRGPRPGGAEPEAPVQGGRSPRPPSRGAGPADLTNKVYARAAPLQPSRAHLRPLCALTHESRALPVESEQESSEGDQLVSGRGVLKARGLQVNQVGSMRR
ncbi:unnamed protein product [Boreogadus saida]